MKYSYILYYPDGEKERSSDRFNSYQDAEEAALYDCSCAKEGNDIMSRMGDMDEYMSDDDIQYEVIEIDDDD